MGNYSYTNTEEYTNDIDAFLKRLAPHYDTTIKHWGKDKPSSMLTHLPKKYRKLDKDQLLTASLLAMENREVHYPTMDIEAEELTIGIDGWKIQGYWYKSFCNMLELFQELGLRGSIHMSEETDQDFEIKFTDEGVEVEIWESAEGEERGDEWIITTPSCEMESDTYKIDEGGIK